MQQSNPNILDYVQYLQNLLSNYNIPFQSHQQYIHSKTFHKQEQLSQNLSKQKPLQTTLLPQLSSSNFLRYSRQMLLKQIGYNNQIKIIKSKVAIVGSGGIGCPVALYLAGAGIGQIGLFDSDTVQITNLHRQIAHKNKNIGKKKTTSLKQALLQFNPTLTIRQHSNITLQSINELDYYDLIIDGSDNPHCRYLLNDYVKSKNISKKLLSGACIGWEAQITCYSHFVQQDSSQKSTACYRCLWGNQQKPTGGCAAQGVIGMLPGIVGLILGVQALKILTQGKSSLEGQLLTYDGRTCSFRKMKLRGPKQDCIMCGENKIDMMDYNYNFHNQCSMNEPPKDAPSISWTEYFKQNISSMLLDVRPSAHFKMVSLVNSKNIPFEDLITMQKQELQERLKENGLNQKIYTMCRAGINSKKATNFLIDHGIDAVSIQGGINQYADKFDADLPQL